MLLAPIKQYMLKPNSLYVIFSIFGMINFVFYLVLSLIEGNSLEEFILKSIGLMLCIFLFFINLWPKVFYQHKEKIWLAIITYCLPFITIYMYILNSGHESWMVKLILTIFVLIIITDWLELFITLSTGAIGAIIAHLLFYNYFYIPQITISVAVINILWIIIASYIFNLRRILIEHKTKKTNYKLLNKFRSQNKKLINALKSKKDFLNNVSHEIRTPMQGILGISNILSNNWGDMSENEKRELATKISKNSDRLMSLVSGLLDLAKLEACKMNFIIRPESLVAVTQEVIEEFNYSMQNYKINFTPSSINDYCFNFDPDRIAQVIRNLISNAIKYGGKDNIVIEIKDTKIDEIEAVQLTVTDHGKKGIQKYELEKIFLPFEESVNTKSQAGGTGLGLAICKEIVEAHNGKIYAKSRKVNDNFKTSFSLILPKNLTQTTKQAIDQIIEDEEKLKFGLDTKNKAKILLVDDEEACLLSGELMLKSLDYDVVTAAGGKEAKKILSEKKNNIDLILLDLMMPDIHGLDLLKEIKKDKNLQSIPIMIQSGVADPNDIDKAFANGAVDFINKPYMKTNLKKIIENYFN